MKRLFLTLLVALIPATGWTQASVLQGGSFSPGYLPTYSSSGGSQPVVQNSGTAAGTGVGVREISVIARGTACNTAQAPVVCAAQGTGQLGTIVQIQDAGSANAGGYHALSFSPNDGTGALIAYNAYGGASALPLRFNVNSTDYEFPFVTGGIVGPGTTVVNDAVCWNNTSGTLVKTCPGSVPLTIGGTNGQIQYNNAGALGGFTMSGDATINTTTGAITVSKIGNVSVSLGGTLTTAAAFTQAGAFATTLTSTGITNVTLPTTGTLATRAGVEALTNKTINGLTITASTGTLTIVNGKVLTASNTLSFAGTDGSTLNIGTGGTLGTAAYTAATAYMPANPTAIAKAWVNFTGGGTTINSSLNVTSITRNGAGDYTVTFTSALGANPVCFSSFYQGGGAAFGSSFATATPTTTAARAIFYTIAGALTDPALGYVMCYSP